MLCFMKRGDALGRQLQAGHACHSTASSSTPAQPSERSTQLRCLKPRVRRAERARRREDGRGRRAAELSRERQRGTTRSPRAAASNERRCAFQTKSKLCRRRTPLPAQLLDELEKFEKGLTGDMNVSAGAPPAPPGPRDRRAATRGDPPAGLKDPEDIFLTTWNVAIMGPLSTVYENRLYSCELARPGALRARGAARRRFRRAQVCGPRYPSVPPEVKFMSKINMSAVDGEGNVVRVRRPRSRGARRPIPRRPSAEHAKINAQLEIREHDRRRARRDPQEHGQQREPPLESATGGRELLSPAAVGRGRRARLPTAPPLSIVRCRKPSLSSRRRTRSPRSPGGPPG